MIICLASTFDCYKRVDNIYSVKYALESYHYLKERKYTDEFMNEYVKTRDFFILDSGAFTYMNDISKGKAEINWDKYIENYAAFIKKYQIKNYIELDIDVVVGLKEVERLRKKLEDIVGWKCIPVWHKSRGWNYWEYMVKNYNYVSIGGLVTREIKQKEYSLLNKFIKVAHKNKCKVHGLGFTSMKYLSQIKFDTVDSTSWKSGRRFALCYKFENGKIKQKSYKNKRLVDYDKLDMENLKAWILLQEYANIHY